jgi:hypothetical protein
MQRPTLDFLEALKTLDAELDAYVHDEAQDLNTQQRGTVCALFQHKMRKQYGAALRLIARSITTTKDPVNRFLGRVLDVPYSKPTPETKPGLDRFEDNRPLDLLDLHARKDSG